MQATRIKSPQACRKQTSKMTGVKWTSGSARGAVGERSNNALTVTLSSNWISAFEQGCFSLLQTPDPALSPSLHEWPWAPALLEREKRARAGQAEGPAVSLRIRRGKTTFCGDFKFHSRSACIWKSGVSTKSSFCFFMKAGSFFNPVAAVVLTMAKADLPGVGRGNYSRHVFPSGTLLYSFLAFLLWRLS